MLFVVDVGNTNIVFAVFEDDKLIFETRTDTIASRMSDQYALFIDNIFSFNEIDKKNIKGAIISSVVPPVTPQLKTAIDKMFGVNSLVVGPGLKTGVNIKIEEQTSVGADLICACVGAKAQYPTPCVVVDMGTVTKILAIDASGSFIGGVLFPGVRVSTETLSDSAALLPMITVTPNSAFKNSVIRSNTVDCMNSGMLNGMACMLDGLVKKIEAEIDQECYVIGTGGHFDLIRKYCERKYDYNPYLLLEGLRLIFNKN